VLRVLARSGNQFLPTVVLSVEYEEEGLRVVQVGPPGCRRVPLPCRQGKGKVVHVQAKVQVQVVVCIIAHILRVSREGTGK